MQFMQNYITDTLWRRYRFIFHRLLTRKLTLYLLSLLVFILSQKLYAQQEKAVSFGAEKESLGKALDKLAKTSGINIIYPSIETGKYNNISLPVASRTLKATLDLLLKETTLDYKFVNNKVVVFKKEKIPEPANKITVQGVVTDENNNPVQGITVAVNGTQRGTATNSNGNFVFENVAATALLTFQGVGYPAQVLSVKENMQVILKQQTSTLDEVQIIAYGTTTKRLNTGNVASLKGEEISKHPVSNVLATLQGQIPGLQITETSGLPGAAIKVQLRGRTAIAQNITDDQPLFIVDGVPFGANNSYLNSISSSLGSIGNESFLNQGGVSPLNSLNIGDIASIEVLKDADATAIYGSRGANGVVIITTKKGTGGGLKVTLDISSGYSSAPKNLKMMTTPQYLAIRRQAFTNDKTTMTTANAYDLLSWDTLRSTDFYKFLNGEIAGKQNVQLSLSGGSKNTRFLLTGNYSRTTSISPGDLAYNKAGVFFSLNHFSDDRRLQINFTGNYTADNNELTGRDFAYNAIIPPNMKVYNNDGTLAWNEGGIITPFYSNPLSYLNSIYNAKTNNLISNFLISYKILNQLSVKINSGYNEQVIEELSLYPATAQNPDNTINRTRTYSHSKIKNWIAEPQIEYSGKFPFGATTVLLGTTFQSVDQNRNGHHGSGFASDYMMGSVANATSTTVNNSSSQYRYNAIFGRFNYNYENKYLLNLTARRDGSSRFGPDQQFANFGAVGAGWIFSEEDFARKNLSVLSFGKIRGSYGITGNDKISNYQYLDTYTSNSYRYNGNPLLYPNKLYNPNYRWEKTEKWEAGLELGFAKDKLLFTASYYTNKSSNQLINYRLPSTVGFGSVIANFPALVINKGWELTFNANIANRSSFNWSVSANISVPKHKLASFPNLANSSYYSQYIEGKSLNLIYKFDYKGVDTKTGLFSFNDIDSNGSLNTNDYVYSGDLDPDLFGGVTNSFRFKRFHASFLFSFIKQKGYNYLAQFNSLNGFGSMNNLPEALWGMFWQKEGDNAKIQKLSQNQYGETYAPLNNLYLSNGIYGDASFGRLKNVYLSYSADERLVNKILLKTLSIFFQGQNLLTISNYKIGDPENQNWMRTPPLKTFTFGIKAEF